MLRRNFLCLVMLILAFSVNAEEEAPAPESQYVELAPSFVANYGTGTGKLKFIKTDITLRVPSKAAAAIVESNMPMLRHEVVMLLSRQSQEDMNQPNSQETIRQAALEAVNSVIKEETGTDQVTDLLFISFVIQG